MEDDKKKKKSKKKKKQQVKSAAEDVVSNAGSTSSHEQNLVNQSVVSTSVDVGDNRPKVNAEDKGANNAEASNGSLSTDDGKLNRLLEEAKLRDMVKKLLYEKDTYVDRQVILEQRINQLLQEQDSLNFEKRDLLEKIRHIEKEKALLVEKENSSKEMITALENENNRLRVQVVQLEGAKNSVSQENRQLLDNISTLQSRILDVEMNLASAHSSEDVQKNATEKEDLNAQIEAACVLVEKLVTENAELVEKMNDLYMELGSRNVGGDVVSVVIPDYATVRDPTSISYEGASLSAAKAAKNSEILPIKERLQYDVDVDRANNAVQYFSETGVSEEIVQIPLDENEAQKQDLEAQPQPSNNEEDQVEEVEGVPLTDAPLTGAPFRLISYVASFMSGADLVNKSYSDSLQ